jgi:eukaryotic-like serine/threonine-protein kinase
LPDPSLRSALEEATTARLDTSGPHSEPPRSSGTAGSDPPASDPPSSDPPAAQRSGQSVGPSNKEAAQAGQSAQEGGRSSHPGRRSTSDRPPPIPRASSGGSTSDRPPPPLPRASRAGAEPAPAEPAADEDGPKQKITLQPDAVGRTLDSRYRIEERLGMGGVGAVYLGTQLALGRAVAIKLLHEGLDPSFRTRFEREAKALAALRHPNIVSVTDYGVDDATPYLVMEKLEGETLGERLTRGPLLPEHVLELTRQLLRALGFVHEQGLVHRDLKPGNLFLELTPDGDERLKLLDFGLAKFVQEPGVEGETVTRAGHVVGTPAYMAPEQIAGDAVDARSDIYAVGVLLFQMLSGKVPFEGEPMEQLKGHLVAPVPPLVVTQTALKPRRELSALVTRALEKRREARFESALEMLTAVEAVPQPWLVDPVLVDGEPESDSQGAAKTALHKGAQKRHAAAQKAAEKERGRPGRAPLLLALLFVVIALLAVQRLHDSAAEPDPPGAAEAPTAVPTAPDDEAPAAEAVAGRKSADMDMVIALREAAHEQATQAPADLSTGAATTEAIQDPSVAHDPNAGPPADPAGAGAEAESVIHDQQAAAELAARPALPPGPPAGWRNPWTRDTPAALRTIRKAVMEGERGNDRMIATLRKYNRNAADKDARGHLLLARMYLNRGWREDALNQYTIAFHVDPGSRGAPKMLSDVLTLVAYSKTYRDASRFVREAYGAEAMREIDRALLAYKQDPAAVARLKALRATLTGA